MSGEDQHASTDPAGPGDPAAPDTLLPHEAALRARIRDFEPAALLDLLQHFGYRRERIRFRGYFVHAPQPTLFHDVAFAGGVEPVEREVTVTVNLGLLSCRSPLPSYLARLIEEEELLEGSLTELLRALDQGLIATRLRGFHPDRDLKLFPDPWGVRHDLLRLTSLRSPVTLDWLFRRIYPELGVLVHRSIAERFLPAPPSRLGSNRVGEAVMGDEARAHVQGLEVVLLAEEHETYDGQPWPAEARRRLHDLVFPLLGETGLTLVIVLLLARGHSAQFDHRSHVGYDPLVSERGPHHLLLFSGRVPSGSSSAGKL